MTLPAYARLGTRPVAKPEVQEKEDKGAQRDRTTPLEALQGMTINEFRASGLAVVVSCLIPGEEVVLAADGTPTSLKGFDERGRVVFRGEELRLLALLGTHPEDLQAYHKLRSQIGAVTVESIQTPQAAAPLAAMADTKKKGTAA